MSTKLSRAQVLIGETKKAEFFSDFVTSFAKTPVGEQLGKVTNEKAVNQSLKNIILTNLGERLFQPTIGSSVMNSLFEHNDIENLSSLEFYIQSAINNNEPRVNLIDVTVTSSKNDEHYIEFTITYSMINNPEVITFTYILKRVR